VAITCWLQVYPILLIFHLKLPLNTIHKVLSELFIGLMINSELPYLYFILCLILFPSFLSNINFRFFGDICLLCLGESCGPAKNPTVGSCEARGSSHLCLCENSIFERPKIAIFLSVYSIFEAAGDFFLGYSYPLIAYLGPDLGKKNRRQRGWDLVPNVTIFG
jgi:hypothetical protein